MSYKLEKPYTEKQKLDFVVEYNHNKGLEIEETSKALYALEDWELLQGDEVIDNTEEYEQEQAKKERERRNQEIDNKIKELYNMATVEMIKNNKENVDTYCSIINSLIECKS